MTIESRICAHGSASSSRFLLKSFISALIQTLRLKCQKSPSAKTGCSSSPSFSHADQHLVDTTPMRLAQSASSMRSLCAQALHFRILAQLCSVTILKILAQLKNLQCKLTNYHCMRASTLPSYYARSHRTLVLQTCAFKTQRFAAGISQRRRGLCRILSFHLFASS